MPNLGIILIFVAVLASPSPQPSAAPPPDPCGGAHTNLLAALNRPSIGYSPCAVKRGDTLLEAGYANAAGPAGSTPNYPQGFLRAGTAPGLELDLLANGRFDSGIGAKFEFWHDGSRALALDALYLAPTGSAQYTAGAPVETLNLDYAMPVSSKFGLAATLGMQSGYAGGRFFSLLPSAVLSDQWNPRAQAFVEAFAQTRTHPGGGALFGVDGALQYLLTPRLEADVEAGETSVDGNRSHFAGAGIGVRF